MAEKINDDWVVHQWIKKAVLLSFRLSENAIMGQAPLQFYDKVPLFSEYGDNAFKRARGAAGRGPPWRLHRPQRGADALLRQHRRLRRRRHHGRHLATVGSCAQIGKNVHLSGGVGIGGVLEPLQANPTIIEDNCFIGARSEVVEGVVVEENSVLAMGVFLSQSTKIYDRATGKITYGRVPSGSVVVPGSLPSADGSHSLACAVIVKRVDAQTRAKTSINDLLRA